MTAFSISKKTFPKIKKLIWAHINRTQKENTLGKKDTNSITVFETNKGLKKSRRNNNKGERETRDGDR